MNYLQLINKCLLELNYREVNSFSELVKNDHKKIMNILNIVNKEICTSTNWNFLLRTCQLTIGANLSKIDKPINGRILYFLVDGKEFKYHEDIGPFIKNKAPDSSYSLLNDKILISPYKKDRTLEIYYYSANCAADSSNVEKSDMTAATDSSLIPMPFAEQLLVYGTCLRIKANPSYIRFSYWMSMYKEALLNLRSKTSVYANDAPFVKVYRK